MLSNELVVPNVPALPGRGSEDSPVLPRPSPSFDQSMLRADSPATSMASSLPRSPVSPKFSPGVQPPPPPTAPPSSSHPTAGRPSQDDIEAHRQRETKWVALLGATKPADARKNKKVRKLLQEGVPASVRYKGSRRAGGVVGYGWKPPDMQNRPTSRNARFIDL